jgi:transcription initiation factor TFIIH subunit 1
MENQRKGKSSRLIDPKPGISTTGDMKMTITPQLAQDIFEEWPVIRRAFAENVPTNVSIIIIIFTRVTSNI